MADMLGPEVPQTLEGWYMQHEVYALDWARWRALNPGQRDEIATAAGHWLAAAAGCGQGDSAAYSVLTQKGDLMLLHYRETPEQVNRVELSLRQLRLFDFLIDTYSYFSVIELGLHELTSIVLRKLADQGIVPGSEGYDELFDTEMEKQKLRVRDRLFCPIPDRRYICFYPMNKRRGEQVNWYTLPIEERRNLMRGHARIGHKYHAQVTQIVGGSIGLDDWEWSVSLHADDVLALKQLLYEMRFDPASALYGEFGPFYIGIRMTTEQFPALLAGQLQD